MILQIPSSNRHFNAYHQNNSLLFQFILAEFLDVYQEIRKIEALKNEGYETLGASLVKLVGASRDYMRFFAWNFSDGTLSKLKNYCALFSENADGEEKEPIAIQHYADKAWGSCLQATDLLLELPEERATIALTIEKGCNAVHRFAKLIVRVITQFRDDENVVFFVLKHHQKFDALFGSRFISKLFSRMYPKGIKEVRHFLLKKYEARGFENILPTIEAKITEIL